MKLDGIVLLGPTASGKTALGVNVAFQCHGEIISADSRQVYKSLNIGTGKDLGEFYQFQPPIPYHLIDVTEPNTQFYLKNFIEQSQQCINEIQLRNKLPIICGGTGLYLDTFHKDFSHTFIPENESLRLILENDDHLTLISKIDSTHFKDKQLLDISTKKRCIRALEKIEFLSKHDLPQSSFKKRNLMYFGLNPSVETRRNSIDTRLKIRIELGLIEEVEQLLSFRTVDLERLEKLGLEYKFVARFLQKKLTKSELFEKLSVAIHQYAKRQMTWFRKMEKEGIKIHWIPNEMKLEEKIHFVSTFIQSKD